MQKGSLTTGTISDQKKIIENEKFQLLRKSKYMGPKKETKYNYKRELCH